MIYLIVGKTRKNAYLVLQPSYSIESFADDHDPDFDQNTNASVVTNHLTSAHDNAKTIPLSQSEDDFPLIEFKMSASVQKSINKLSTPVCTEKRDIKDTGANNDGPLVGQPHNFVKSGSVPCKPLKTSISADNVKYFSATPEINFIKINDDHKKSNPYKFEAKSTPYPRSVSAHQGLKSSYQFSSTCNLSSTNVNSSSTHNLSENLCNENRSVDAQNALKFTDNNSSLKKSASHPVICDLVDTQKNTTGGSGTHHQKLRSLKSSSLSPSLITRDTSKSTKPKGNNGMKFKFSEPAVVQPVAAYVLEVDSPQQYSDIEKDAECSEIYCTDEVPVSHLESQDVRKQLFADTENDPADVLPHQKELDGGSKDDELFGNPLRNAETNIDTKCSGLLEEISSDLAEKHRYNWPTLHV